MRCLLATLDTNKDGRLSGDELSGVYVWRDANSNAIAEKEEVVASSSLISSLSVSPERKDGNAWCTAGAVLRDGRVAQSWDWWSMIQVRYVDRAGVRVPVLDPFYIGEEPVDCASKPGITAYVWQQEASSMTGWKSVRGLMRFFQVGQQVYVVTASPYFGHERFVGVAEVYREGTKLFWGLSSGGEGPGVRGEVELQPDGTLVGMCYYSGEPPVAIEAKPLKDIERIHWDLMNFLAFPDASFVEAMKGSPHQIYVPYGGYPVCHGKGRDLSDLFTPPIY